MITVCTLLAGTALHGVSVIRLIMSNDIREMKDTILFLMTTSILQGSH